MKRKRILIPGGSGFLGRTLAKYFSARGWEVIVLSRDPNQQVDGATVIGWDAKILGPWTEWLDGAEAVINLSGRSVNCRYTERNRRAMMDSRVLSTRILGEAIARCGAPPRVWINSSTATIYTHRYDAPNDEATGLYGATAEAKDAYSLDVAHAWEVAFHQAYHDHGLNWTRPVLIRSAMVFGEEPGGVWHTLRRLTKLGLGGRMGHGKQFVSWLHAKDFCRAIEWLIEDQAERRGIYNLCAPQPLTNATMMQLLRDELNRPIGLPAPRWLLEVGAFFLRTETELIIKSRRVIPNRLEREGFRFHFADLRSAVHDLELSKQPAPVHASPSPQSTEPDHGLDHGVRSALMSNSH